MMTTTKLTTALTHLNSIDLVEWIDTDASEDEDHLPQISRNNHSTLFSSIECRQTNREANANNCCIDMNATTELSGINYHWDTNCAKVTDIINKVVDNSNETVDLSGLGLTKVPDEIKELSYLTVIHNGLVKPASLEIFLFNNHLVSLNSALFTLKNLTVLSLRHNHLTSIPPEIVLLESLAELSVGNNQLKYIPAELLRLKKLKLLTLLPNPYLSFPEKTHRLKTAIASLKEISIRSILKHKTELKDSVIPTDLAKEVSSVSSVNHCEECHIQIKEPDIEEIVKRDVFEYSNIPVLYRLCSITCLLKLPK